MILSGAGIWGIWQTANAEVAPQLLMYLVPIILFLILVPILSYRAYALHRSRYILDRNGIILQWGWRYETLPMDEVKWISPLEDLDASIKPPRIRWPGSVLGQRGLSQSPSVEFIAANLKQAVVIAGPDHFYVISPSRVDQFIDTFHRITELGPLNPLVSQASRPTFLITQLWKQKPILILTSIGAALLLILTILTITVIPQREQISLGFTPQGTPHRPLPSIRLILLPILYTISYTGNLVVGLFLYRREQNRQLAYLLWVSSIIVGLIFLISMFFILS